MSAAGRSESDVVFTTPRLVARRWRDSDIDALLAVYGDADGVRWVGDGQPITLDGCAQWLTCRSRASGRVRTRAIA